MTETIENLLAQLGRFMEFDPRWDVKQSDIDKALKSETYGTNWAYVVRELHKLGWKKARLWKLIKKYKERDYKKQVVHYRKDISYWKRQIPKLKRELEEVKSKQSDEVRHIEAAIQRGEHETEFAKKMLSKYFKVSIKRGGEI